MKIADSAIQLYSDHSYLEQHEKKESLTVWKNGQEAQSVNANNEVPKEGKTPPVQLLGEADKVSLSPGVRKGRPVRTVAPPVPDENDFIADLNIRILKAMIERFTGKKIQLAKPGEGTQVAENQVAQSDDGEPPVEEGGFGLAYDYFESHYEYEATQFAAEGKILTEDGQEVDFSLELNMSREFYSEQSMSIRAGEALKDPLVVNFDGTAAELTQTHFSFDIDADGNEDQISFVTPNSGFLALDVNGDNSINDGTELFGAVTGNGFQELADFDDDGNNWIDENDSIYDRLRIWSKTSGGEDRLFSLGQKGIGAIYLGHIDTPFSLKNTDNELLGQVRSSGFFLNENGSGGTIQQIDLVA